MAAVPDGLPGNFWRIVITGSRQGLDRVAAAWPEVEGEVNVPEATDRQALSRTQPLKPRALAANRATASAHPVRAGAASARLTVVLENVHDPHNVSAILRSCDGVGVLQAHAVYSIEEPPPGMFARQTSASAAKWVDVERHRSLTDCYQRLRADGFAILVTSIGPNSRPLYDWDLTGPIALVLGNEMRGSQQRRETWPTGQSRSRWSVWWRA